MKLKPAEIRKEIDAAEKSDFCAEYWAGLDRQSVDEYVEVAYHHGLAYAVNELEKDAAFEQDLSK